MGAICVPAQSQAAGGWFLCPSVLTAEPPPWALKNCLWLLMRHPERRKAPLRGKMNHQNECREKWENGAGIQIKLSWSIHQDGRKNLLSYGHSTSCGHWYPRACPQHSCSVTYQWKHWILTSELLYMHWECSETGIWKHTREHSYQSTKVPSMVCFYEY